jgi:hypothetical protein
MSLQFLEGSPFARVTPRKPPRVIALPQGYFREGTKSPLPGTRFGIRRLSVADAERAKGARKDAEKFGEDPDFAMMVHIVAASLTLPDDVSTPLLKAADLEVRALLTPQGVKYLYDVVETMHAEVAPIYDPASDAAVERLCKLVTDPATWKRLGKREQKVRRLLTYVLDYLTGLCHVRAHHPRRYGG